MVTTRYTSPLRPLDIGYVSRVAGVAIDWDATEITRDWKPDTEYGFVDRLPAEVVESFQLRYAGNGPRA